MGLAPRGQCEWAVNERTKRELVKERALVEAGIGAVKSSRYNFHRPRARSTRMMGACGQAWGAGLQPQQVGPGSSDERQPRGPTGPPDEGHIHQVSETPPRVPICLKLPPHRKGAAPSPITSADAHDLIHTPLAVCAGGTSHLSEVRLALMKLPRGHVEKVSK